MARDLNGPLPDGCFEKAREELGDDQEGNIEETCFYDGSLKKGVDDYRSRILKTGRKVWGYFVR